MNTLRAFQGIDTAFAVTLNPSVVDFSGAPPDLTARVHRGDGNAGLATMTPTWQDVTEDIVAVPFPGTMSAGMEAGNYFLTVSIAGGAAVLSHDSLVIYPTPSGTVPIRSLVTPAEMIGVIPELQSDPTLTQMDALPWLLEAATVACESYVGHPLVRTVIDEIDYTWMSGVSSGLRLSSWPVAAFRMQSNPQPGIQLKGPTSATRSLLTFAVNSGTDIGVKTLTLSRTGVADTVLTIANYATIADLAAAAVLSGWTATTNYGTRSPSDLVAVYGPTTLGAKDGADVYLFTDDVDGYRLDVRSGDLDMGGMSYRHTWSTGSHLGTAVRLTYMAGYSPVPKDLKAACIAMAIHLREAAKTAGPVQQQGMRDKYYTLSPTVRIPAPIRAILDQYADTWAVA